jgi:hypothetical protein
MVTSSGTNHSNLHNPYKPVTAFVLYVWLPTLTHAIESYIITESITELR